MKLVNRFINVWLIFSIATTIFAFLTDCSLMAYMKGSGFVIDTVIAKKVILGHTMNLLKDLTMILLLKFVLIRFVKNEK